MHLIIKMKGKVTLKLESISFIEVQVPRDISGNKKYQINANAYLPNGIIPLDPIHSFEKTPRTLQLPFLNVSTYYESIPRGSLLGTFEPVNEEINEVHTTCWEKLDNKCNRHIYNCKRKEVTGMPGRKFEPWRENHMKNYQVTHLQVVWKWKPS